MENLGLGIICLIGGLFTLAAAACNWDWFLAHRKARLFLKLLGHTGARVFYGVLGTILLIAGGFVTVGAVMGGNDHLVIVQTNFPGANALLVASWVAAPLDHQFADHFETKLIDSEVRADGSYVARIHMSSELTPMQAEIAISNRINVALSTLPADIKAEGVKTRLAIDADVDRTHVIVALVNLLDEPDPAFDALAGRVYQRIVAEGLVREPATLRPPEEDAPFEVIDRAKCAAAGVDISVVMRCFRQALAADPRATDETLLKIKVPAAGDKEVAYGDVASIRREKVPTVIYRVNDHPALRIVGLPPEGTSPAKAAARCVKLAQEKITKAGAGETIAVINLTPR